MGDQYSVQREALYQAAKYVSAANDPWLDICDSIDRARLSAGDLGIIGDKTDVIEKYNAGVDFASSKMAEGSLNLEKMQWALEEVARNYGHAERKSTDLADSIDLT